MPRTPGGLTYRDYTPDASGYRYRQFADGTITILASPRGGVGTSLRSGPAWQAITDQITAYRNGRTVDTVKTVALVATALTQAAFTASKKPRRRRPSEPPPPVEAPSVAPVENEMPIWPWLAAGVAVVGAALFVGAK